MRIAVKSTGGVTEAARHIAEVYCLPTDIELWSAGSDGGPPRKLGELRFVAVDADDNVVELDLTSRLPWRTSPAARTARR